MRRSRLTGLNGGPWIEKRMPVRYDGFASRNTLLDDHPATDVCSRRHSPWLHRFIGLDYVNEWTLLARLHRLCGNGRRSLRTERHDDIYETARPQQTLFVIESCFQPDCPRVWIHLVVDDRKRSMCLVSRIRERCFHL